MIKKINLPFKIAIVSFVITFIGIVIVSYFNFKMTDQILSEHSLRFLSKDVEEKRRGFTKQLKCIPTKLLNVIAATETQSLLKPSKDIGEVKDKISSLFNMTLKQNSSFMAIRLIDVKDNNKELIKHTKQDEKNLVLSKNKVSEHQEEKDFQISLGLKKGDFYISEVTLNKHSSQIVIPHESVFYVSSGLYDSDDTLVYLIELKASFSQFTHLLNNKENNHYYFLANQYGQYVFHPDSDKSMGFALNKVETFQKDFPFTKSHLEVMKTLKDGSNHSFKSHKDDIVLSLSHFHFDQKDPNRIAIIGAVKKLSLLQAESNRLYKNSLFIIIMVSLILAWITYHMARRVSEPIINLKLATDKISNDEKDVQIPIDGYDEIVALGHSFTKLLTKLTNLTKELESTNKDLEQQVIDRTTDLNRSKQSIEIQNHKLNKALEQAKIASLSKDRFLAMMSHEIRTPLNGVLGLTELLLDSKLDNNQRESLETVHSSGEILLTILNDILDYSKMVADKFEIKLQEFSLNDLLEHTVKLYAKDAYQKNIEIFTNIIPNLQHQIIGDPDRLSQIFMNLLSNSIKFTHEGEVFIQADLLNQDDTEVTIRFNIIDSGIGIAKGDQKRLFNDFIQIDQSDSRKYGGTGLGLSIVQKLVKLMDGEIYIDSQEQKGSRFWFDLKFSKGERLKDCPYFYKESFLKHNTLVIDGNSKHRDSLVTVLTQWGVAVNSTSYDTNITQKLQDSINQNTPYDSIILIHNNSILCTQDETNGTKTYNGCPLQELLELRDLEHYKHLNIILVSSSQSCKLIDSSTHYNHLLPKPLSLKGLSDALLIEMGVKKASVETPKVSVEHRLEKILIVEDVLVNQKVAIGMLKKLSFHNIHVANDGLEAVDQFKNNKYDLILMDLQMPNMDGYEATKTIRSLENSSNQRVPIVALTAHAFVTEKTHSKEIGMDDLLTKPLTLKSLKKTLDTWLPETTTGQVAKTSTVQQSLDPSVIKRLYDDMGEGIGDILDIYVEELPQHVQDICDCLVTEDPTSIKKSAHKLKGASRNFGVVNIIEICIEIENKSANIKSIDIPSLIDTLTKERDNVISAFKDEWLQKYR